MKTKNKTIAFLEITVVLCSVFLVAMPATAVAAEEDDFVLDIYGNANEDDTIDMRDLTYVKLIFFGKKPGTELADAKYDGKINPLDFIQIKLIIVGKEKELTYVDIFGEAETVNKPIKRVVVMDRCAAEAFRMLNAKDKVVAITKNMMAERYIYFPEFSKLPLAGYNWNEPDFEAILAQNPDAVITYIPQAVYWAKTKAEWEEKLPSVNIITLGFVNPPTGNKWTDIDRYNDLIQSTRKLGYIFDKEAEAEEFCDWYEGHFNTIKSRTDELSEDEKPRIFQEWNWDYYSPHHITRERRMCDIAGGRDIAADLPYSGNVDPEWVMEQNPDMIIGIYPFGYLDYETDDPSEIIAKRENILNRPELANVAAVKNDRVYVQTFVMTNGPHTIANIAYMAKWLHPELFEDLDPEEIHQEFIDRFCPGLDYDVKEHGIFVYPPLTS
ncbi:hypothetical protein CW713_03555 [Methanophagales archaeon]|nr:MAG: hypothetical protein CW713_03555 [Methanophagales archaeon]